MIRRGSLKTSIHFMGDGSPYLNFKSGYLTKMMDLILYSKSGCHLCEGLLEKLEAIAAQREDMTIEIRDITTDAEWFAAYQYEIPVLRYRDAKRVEYPIRRPSPRLDAAQLEKWLQKSICAS